jgi:putative acetyltransferase
MQLQAGIAAVTADDYPRVVDVWQASVRATHHFITEADIAFFRPLVWEALPHMDALLSVRNDDGQVAGFIGVAGRKVEMLFIHPDWRGQGGGKRLLQYAVTTLGATQLDVNEQNEQAVGFYLQMGFDVVGRSARDGAGKPYPLLHMRARSVANSHMV